MATPKLISLVTGGNGGIGFDTCAALASQAQHHVIMGSRSLDKGQKAMSEILSRKPAGSISLVQLDVNSDDSIQAAARHIESQYGKLDTLVNNAGIISPSKDMRTAFRETFETNVYGPNNVTAAFEPLLKQSQAPRIIYVSSLLGSIEDKASPTGSAKDVPYRVYRASKAALNMIVACDHVDYAKDGFKVFAFCPGYVVTDLAGERESKEKSGVAGSSTVSAESIAKIVNGERDADAGKFLHKDGLYQW